MKAWDDDVERQERILQRHFRLLTAELISSASLLCLPHMSCCRAWDSTPSGAASGGAAAGRAATAGGSSLTDRWLGTSSDGEASGKSSAAEESRSAASNPLSETAAYRWTEATPV